MKRFFRVWMSILLCSMAVLAGGVRTAATRTVMPQGSELSVIIDEIDVSRYQDERLIQAYVTVRYPQTGPLQDLEADNFTLQIAGGAPFTPDTAETATAPVSMGIVFELFNSMARNNGFETAKNAVSKLCQEKAVDDRVAIFSVRRGVDTDSRELDPAHEYEFSTDGGAVSNFVQERQMVGGTGTPLYDTILKAIRYTVQVSEEPIGRRAIIVITDGGDRESVNPSSVVIDAAREFRIPVYTIGYTRGNRDYDQFLNELANRTGGSHNNTPDPEQFDDFLEEVRQELALRYVLTIPVEDFATRRQLLDVRVNYKGLVGSTNREFDVEIDAPPSGETPPPTTAEPGAPSDPEATTAPEESTTTTDEQNFLEKLLEWVEDNVLYVAIGGALLLLLLIVVIVVLRKKKSTAPGSPVYTPPPDQWGAPTDDWGTPTGGATISGAGGPTAVVGGAAPTAMDAGPGDAWSTPTPYYQDRTAAMGSGPVYPDYGRPQPPQPVQPSPGGDAPPSGVPKDGAPKDGGTVIISRAPKMAHEALLINRRANRTYELTKPEMRLGRSAENEIPLDSEKVSRRHALIVLTGATFYIQDLGSANGTFVNGNQVHDRVALSNGDEIRMGDQTFLFQQLS